VLAAGVTWPVARHPASMMASPFGDPLLNAWILAWDADRALHAFRGYWTGLFFFPYPDTVAYSEHLLGIALFTAPVQWLTGNVVLSYNLALLGAIAFSAFGAWVLARDVSGRDDAALVAAMAFACAPFRAPHLTHLQVLASGWIPLSLWALSRYLRSARPGWLAAWTACFVLNALSNGYYLFFACVPTAMLLAHHVWTARDRRRRTLTDITVASAAAIAALLPVLLAYVRVRREQGLARTGGDNVHFSADVSSFGTVSDRLWLWGGILPNASPELALFPGFLVVAIALAAVLARHRPDAVGGSSRLTSSRLYLAIALVAMVLCLGPRPDVFGWTSPVPGPYAVFMTLIPGLDGLRVPARLNTIVSLALAVLAALGFARVTGHARAPARWGLAMACALGIAAEGWPRPMTLENVPSTAMTADRAAYEWLRDRPPGPLLELPVGDTATRVRYLVSTLVHRHRIVNGYSGYGSALQGFVEYPFGDVDRLDDGLAMVQALGVRYVAVHRPLYTNAQTGDDLIGALRAEDRVRHVEDFGTVAIADIRAAAAPDLSAREPEREIPAAGLHASASARSDLVALAFDRDPLTRWSSGRRQDDAEWFALELDTPTDVARVRLGMGRRTVGDYPRGLRVEGSSDGFGFVTLFDGGVADRLALGILRDGARPAIDIVLRPNSTRVVRLSVTGRTRSAHWSIAELRLWERATGPSDRPEAVVP
jgi:hypothetical protein